ncbi:hypothetical protein PF005_g16761 [Phytophthora fragariae]|uniref:COX assembly mitochondrial protein n=1 Tax=Phytophthora fragariae TaxID=53985 RepID=A0A6A3EPE3_9STRA|nr:hypothetical protein PF009_g18058 [Phytophthora fragariae]KAE9087438.1 hypothetical protein PF007_g20376 [Phytophthora fragariae]KAE9196723.1 hypothetical protein PF005_g16761 [Phytophthora fragariae]
MAVTRSESGAEVNTKKEKKSPEAVDSAVVRAVMDDMECEVNAVKDEESVKNEEQDEDNLRGDEATADMVEPDGRGPNRGGGTGIIILEEVSIERVKNSAVVVVSQGCVVLVGPSQERSVGRHGGCEPANDDPKEEIEDKWSMPASVTSVGGSGKKNVRQTPLRSILKKKEHHSRWKTERPSLCYYGDGIQLGGTAFASWEGGLDEIGELDVALRSTAAEQADSVSVVDNSELVDAENNDGTSSAEAGQKGAIRDPTTQEAEVKPPCDSILTVGELYVLETGFEHSVPASIDVTPEPNDPKSKPSIRDGQGQVALLASVPEQPREHKRIAVDDRHKLKQQQSDIAISKCHSVSEQFAECAKANGIMVVAHCRDYNKSLNARLHQFTNVEHFEIYR